MRKSDKNRVPRKKLEQNIEISDKNRKWKIVLIVLLLAVGITLIVTAAVQALVTPPGWTTISANGALDESCAGDFILHYLLGENGQAANMEQRNITQIYSQATREAFQIFHEERLFDGVNNVAYLNQHPNEAVQVPQVLYQAFSMLEEYENRSVFLAPIYQNYIGLFLSTEDWVAQTYDPAQNADVAAYIQQVLTFTGSQDHIRLELLGENQVKLVVSQEYLQFAQEQEMTAFVDFYWMKNAFIADYLAEALIAAGHTNGTLSSFDGFNRNLDTTDRSYRINIFDRVGVDVYPAAAMEYSQVKTLVNLRNYPTSNLAVQLYYQWGDKRFISCHIDPADGMSKSSVNDLLVYSRSLGCAQVLLETFPVYVADTLDTEAVVAMAQKGVESVYCQGHTLYATDKNVTFTDLFKNEKVTYKKQ
jgi:hypothetical protein